MILFNLTSKTLCMKNFYLLIFLLSPCFSALAQQGNGPAVTAMGDAGVALSNVWAVKTNQAGTANLKHALIAVAYENKFGIKELSTKTAVFAVPIKTYVVGASFQAYGTDGFNEVKTGLSLARAFGQKLSLGIGLNYHQLAIQNYGDARALTVEVGLAYQITPQLCLASHIANPNQSKFGKETAQKIPTQMKFGASYLFNEQVLLASEFVQGIGGQADFKSGIEYKLVKILALRGGLAVNPFKQYGGFGIDYKGIQCDFAIASHPVLGYSPQIALAYEF